MKNYNCKDCTHYNYRDDKYRLGSDRAYCWDYEPRYTDEEQDD